MPGRGQASGVGTDLAAHQPPGYLGGRARDAATHERRRRRGWARVRNWAARGGARAEGAGILGTGPMSIGPERCHSWEWWFQEPVGVAASGGGAYGLFE